MVVARTKIIQIVRNKYCVLALENPNLNTKETKGNQLKIFRKKIEIKGKNFKPKSTGKDS